MSHWFDQIRTAQTLKSLDKDDRTPHNELLMRDNEIYYKNARAKTP